jgi:hypothetical protein
MIFSFPGFYAYPNARFSYQDRYENGAEVDDLCGFVGDVGITCAFPRAFQRWKLHYS